MNEHFTGFQPPRQRELAPGDRQHMREIVLGGLHTTGRSATLRRPLSVAAGVTLLAVGVLLAAQFVHGNSDTTTTGVGTSPEVGTNQDLDRCWTAAHAQGHLYVPGRSTWRPALVAVDGGRHLVGVQIGEQVLFCETTLTTVTVSNLHRHDDVPAGAPAVATLTSDDGVVAGVVAPHTEELQVRVDSGSVGSMQNHAQLGGGMFVMFSSPVSLAHAAITAGSSPKGAQSRPGHSMDPANTTPLTPVEPLVFAVDRPHPGEQSAALTDCTSRLSAGLHETLQDEASLRTGASSTDHDTTNTVRSVVAYNDSSALYCVVLADTKYPRGAIATFRYVDRLPLSDRTPLQLLDEGTSFLVDRSVIAGLLAPNVGRVRITGPDGNSIDATINGAGFGATITHRPGAEVMAQDCTVTVFDKAGRQLYHGSLSGAAATSGPAGK